MEQNQGIQISGGTFNVDNLAVGPGSRAYKTVSTGQVIPDPEKSQDNQQRADESFSLQSNLLDTIESSSQEEDSGHSQKTLPLKVFYCYSHEDEAWCHQIDRHLSVLKRLGHIVAWYDRDILPGSRWKHEIASHLNTADLVLFLVSANFISSDYCFNSEMQHALKLDRLHRTRVIPIILSPVDWRGTPFASLQMLPSGARPVTQWPDQEAALDDIARGIRRVVDDFISLQPDQDRKQRRHPDQ